MGPRFESVKAHQTVYPKAHRSWPVGQVVKTAASHAVNIGSNPVRVTTQKQALDHETGWSEVFLDKLRYRCYNSIWILTGQLVEIVGVDCDEGPPVPIPNTEVKLVPADNTRLATDW